MKIKPNIKTDSKFKKQEPNTFYCEGCDREKPIEDFNLYKGYYYCLSCIERDLLL